MPVLTPGLGTDGNHSCGLRSNTAADEDSAAASLLGVVDHSAFHAAGDRYDLAGDMARKNG
jgi:hypothetical protein